MVNNGLSAGIPVKYPGKPPETAIVKGTETIIADCWSLGGRAFGVPARKFFMRVRMSLK